MAAQREHYNYRWCHKHTNTFFQSNALEVNTPVHFKFANFFSRLTFSTGLKPLLDEACMK